jgi:hypothetical protein
LTWRKIDHKPATKVLKETAPSYNGPPSSLNPDKQNTRKKARKVVKLLSETIPVCDVVFGFIGPDILTNHLKQPLKQQHRQLLLQDTV